MFLKEERELSDMEVSLHRTRSLLGEKIIRLRHLEHSVKHASPRHQSGILLKIGEDATLSDLSSHSGSSGFSSTELHTPADGINCIYFNLFAISINPFGFPVSMIFFYLNNFL